MSRSDPTVPAPSIPVSGRPSPGSAPRRRIAIVGPSHPFRGGIAQHTTLLARTLSKRHDVSLYSFRRQYPTWLFPGRGDRDVGATPLTFPGARRCLSFDDPLSWLRAGDEINCRGYDLMILPWWVRFWGPHDLLLLSRVRRAGGPRVLIACHNVLEHEPSRVSSRLTRQVLRRADGIMVHAASEEKRLRSLVGDDMPVLRAFLPTSFPAGTVGDAGLPAEIGSPAEEETILLFFGFVRPYKGLDVLLDALPAVLSRRRVTLWVVGEFWGDRRPYDRRVVERGLSDHVRIVDRYVGSEEATACFRRATAVVQPYRSATGSGIAPIALDHAVPLVATSVGSLAEMVSDGVNGRLVPPDDPEALAQAILETIDPETNERFRVRLRADGDRWSWERLADRVERFAEENLLPSRM